jgi:hypothetical protein
MGSVLVEGALESDEFGSSVALSQADGGTLVVGTLTMDLNG